MATKYSDSSEDLISEINIVPFVDIILVILIIFMVTTPLIIRPSLNVDLPKAASGQTTTPSSLSISIHQSGRIFFNGKRLKNLKELKQIAKKLVAKNPKIQAIISADKSASHGQVVKVLDTVKSSGVRRFAITTEKL